MTLIEAYRIAKKEGKGVISLFSYEYILNNKPREKDSNVYDLVFISKNPDLDRKLGLHESDNPNFKPIYTKSTILWD